MYIRTYGCMYQLSDAAQGFLTTFPRGDVRDEGSLPYICTGVNSGPVWVCDVSMRDICAFWEP